MNGTNSKEDGAGGGPLSYGQRALWFLQQLEPTNCAYNIAIAGRLTGVLDAGLLEACFRSLVQRHASLHTVFPAIKGKPIQFSRDNSGSLDFNFGQYDASSLAWEDLRERLARECQTPFDLEKGPVLKTMLFRVSEREHVLLLVVHHIAVDYASVVQLVRELGALYAARGSIAAAGLRELTRTYIDYARWQDDMLSGPGGAELWEYWSRQLSGELPVINLPFDRPRQNRQTFRGNTYRFELERRLTAEVRTLARDLRGSPYTVLLAAVFSLLHLYSGQEDVLIGSPPIGRRSGEFDAVVGFFHNPVVLRSVLKPGADFTHVHEEVRRTTELALEHSDYPFSYLVERLKPSRDPGLSPIFQVMFVFYDASVDASLPLALAGQAARIDLGGLDLEFIEIDEAVSMLDLTLTLADENELLSASIQYNTDLFEYSTIEGMSRDLITVLEESAANPGIAIRKLPVAVRRLVACNA
ncbi:MAG TPA: condensation domain-containing protein, partial [Blastocatellia bacterium]|nr:condensation domain-containing protein [Blastocatellia bacterium]